MPHSTQPSSRRMFTIAVWALAIVEAVASAPLSSPANPPGGATQMAGMDSETFVTGILAAIL